MECRCDAGGRSDLIQKLLLVECSVESMHVYSNHDYLHTAEAKERD